MSTFNIKSLVLENRDASPKVLTDPIQSKGYSKDMIGVQRTSAPIIDAGSTIKLLTVSSGARLAELFYAADNLGTSSLDVAVFYPAVIPVGGFATPAASLAGTVVSSSTFAVAIAGVTAGIAWTDAMGLPSVHSIQRRAMPLWQAIGMSADPGIDLDIGFSVRTATALQGYVGLKARFVE